MHTRALGIALLTILATLPLAHAETAEELRARLDAATARAARLADQGRSPVATPRVEALPQPKATPPVDVGALSQRYERLAAEQARAVLTPPGGLLAFVSFSMPRASLERLVSDAEHGNTILVLRGLVDGDLQATFQAVRELLGKRRVAWVLDSEAFLRFDVQVVPTYVLLQPGATHRPCEFGQCYSDADYLKLVGDVPIAYALEHFEAVPGFGRAVAGARSGRGS